MSSNRKAKELLIKYYGAECFIEKLHLRSDKEPRQYTGKSQKQKMKMLTYHHILEKRKRRTSYKRKPGRYSVPRTTVGFINKVRVHKDI